MRGDLFSAHLRRCGHFSLSTCLQACRAVEGGAGFAMSHRHLVPCLSESFMISSNQLKDLLTASDMSRIMESGFKATDHSNAGQGSVASYSFERSRSAHRSQVRSRSMTLIALDHARCIPFCCRALHTVCCACFVQGLLAQYGLSRTEVECWMQANASQDMLRTSSGPTAERQPSTHSAGPFISSSSCGSTGRPMPVAAAVPLGAMGRSSQIPTHFQLQHATRHCVQSDSPAHAAATITSHHRMDSAAVDPQAELKEFEGQVRWLAQQAVKLRNV